MIFIEEKVQNVFALKESSIKIRIKTSSNKETRSYSINFKRKFH